MPLGMFYPVPAVHSNEIALVLKALPLVQPF